MSDVVNTLNITNGTGASVVGISGAQCTSGTTNTGYIGSGAIGTGATSGTIYIGGAGGGGGGAGGGFYGINGTATITTTGLTSPMPPTQEELAELEVLEQQRQITIKQEQVNAFKRVPAPIRQRLVDDILWARELAAIEVAEPAKSSRQLELENKKNSNLYGTLYGGITYGGAGGTGTIYNGSTVTITPGWYSSQGIRPTIPSRMTEDEIIMAHAEATMEEECLNQE
jgi:hypothetical protein